MEGELVYHINLLISIVYLIYLIGIYSIYIIPNLIYELLIIQDNKLRVRHSLLPPSSRGLNVHVKLTHSLPHAPSAVYISCFASDKSSYAYDMNVRSKINDPTQYCFLFDLLLFCPLLLWSILFRP